MNAELMARKLRLGLARFTIEQDRGAHQGEHSDPPLQAFVSVKDIEEAIRLLEQNKP